MKWLEERKNHAWKKKRERSYSYLDTHKDEISDSAYDRIKRTIGSQAIEDMFPDERDVNDMIRVAKGEITATEMVDEIKHRYKKEWGVI